MHYEGKMTAEAALRRFAADTDTAYDIGQHLTCLEAEWLATALAAADRCDAAVSLLCGHALADEDGDSHTEGTAVFDACERIGIVGAADRIRALFYGVDR